MDKRIILAIFAMVCIASLVLTGCSPVEEPVMQSQEPATTHSTTPAGEPDVGIEEVDTLDTDLGLDELDSLDEDFNIEI